MPAYSKTKHCIGTNFISTFEINVHPPSHPSLCGTTHHQSPPPPPPGQVRGHEGREPDAGGGRVSLKLTNLLSAGQPRNKAEVGAV